MDKRNRIKIALAALMLVALACVCSPSGLIEQAAEGVIEDVEGTVQAETGLDLTFEEIQGTAEAVIEEGDLGDLELTVEAAAGGDIEFGDNVESEFPITEDATSVTIIAGSTNYTTSLTIDEAVQFYRDEFTALGYTERTLLTVIEEGTVSFVFDGHSSGEAIVVQMVDLGPIGVNVNVRLEDV